MATERAELTMPIEEAERRLSVQIERGRGLLEIPIQSTDVLEQAQRDLHTWTDYVSTLLERMFSTSEMANTFLAAGARPFIFAGGRTSIQDEERSFKRDVKDHLRALESIRKRLDLLVPASPGIDSRSPTERRSGNRVFVVHGRDEGPREAVARYLERLGLSPVILHEQQNRGRSLQEKLLDTASDAAFAVVLLTPDDECRSDEGSRDASVRARQNVILELGLFLGLLGPDRVVALTKGNVEIPSDYRGIVHIAYDGAGGWRAALIRELKTVWPDLDLDLANDP